VKTSAALRVAEDQRRRHLVPRRPQIPLAGRRQIAGALEISVCTRLPARSDRNPWCAIGCGGRASNSLVESPLDGFIPEADWYSTRA